MSTAQAWLEGARLRTLPAAVAPVVAGTGVAAWADSVNLGMAALCLVIALALQIGVNFANDYSDGIRGTDDERRVGPQRLVGSGAAAPATVRAAAFACFGIAAAAGLALTVWTGHWWFLALGAACIAAAWFYTGGKRPYGYAGLGELFVFIFFGLVAVQGTVFVQTGTVSTPSWWVAVAMGALACDILVANNLRDIAGDREVGKRTLATRLGDGGTRVLFTATAAAAVLAAGLAVWTSGVWWALLGVAAAVVLIRPVHAMMSGAHGLRLIPVLKMTGIAEFLMAIGLALGWFLG